MRESQSHLTWLAELNRLWWSLGTATLRSLPPEFAHELGIQALKIGLMPDVSRRLSSTNSLAMGMTIPGIGKIQHPIGLAAGFDKDCQCPQGLKRAGFSFLEIGTVTPLAQPGNPRPRLFRQRDTSSLINRMGFNNAGANVVAQNLRKQSWDHELCPLGVNVGKNKITSADAAIDDYVAVASAFGNSNRFFVANLSSPNTPGLRELATPEFLQRLQAGLGKRVVERMWIKLDPDMPKARFQALVASALKGEFAGLVLTNTHRVEHPQAGGQSGHSIAIASTTCLEWAWEVHKGTLPMIGVGGILSGHDVFQKLIRGALAVEIYTAFIYRGPFTVALLLEELAQEMVLRGLKSVEECIGRYYQD